MWRESAIRSLLLEEICNLPRSEQPELGESEETGANLFLDKARRRAQLVVLLDWFALAVLFFLRAPGKTWLPVGPTEETVFTIGILALAVHSGFRLGHLEKLRAVGRVLEDLQDRVSSN
jgi:hypothetical protein